MELLILQQLIHEIKQVWIHIDIKLTWRIVKLRKSLEILMIWFKLNQSLDKHQADKILNLAVKEEYQVNSHKMEFSISKSIISTL